MSDDVERLGEALFILSDRLRAEGLIVDGNPVADAYDTVVKEWTAFTASRSSNDEIVEALGEVLAYSEGRTPFNFSRLPADERANEAFDAWQVIQNRIRAVLKVQTGEGHGQ